jgi:MFS transporter, DHA2 family, multidrug resistance protein
VTVPAAVYLLYRIDARLVAITGFIAFAVAAWMGTGLTHDWRADDFAALALVQSIGQGFTFTALLIFALANASPTQGVAIIAYIQMMRLDVLMLMTSGMTTWLRVREQVHSHLIGLHVQAGDAEVTQFLARLARRFLDHGAAETAQARAAASLAGLVRREANVLSLIDGFTVAFWAALIGLLIIALMRAAPPGPLTPQRN